MAMLLREKKAPSVVAGALSFWGIRLFLRPVQHRVPKFRSMVVSRAFSFFEWVAQSNQIVNDGFAHLRYVTVCPKLIRDYQDLSAYNLLIYKKIL